DVGVPGDSGNFDDTIAATVDLCVIFGVVVVWHGKLHCLVERRSRPDNVALNQGENLFIRHRVHVADYGKQDVAVNEPIHEVTEKGKRWVGDHDVCFVAQCRDFVATEVTVAVEV